MSFEISQLDFNVFLGSCQAAKNPEFLRREGISCVVNLTPDDFGWRGKGFEEYQIPIHDGYPFDAFKILPPFFVKMDEWLGAGKKVFIHCHMGISRTSTFAIAWMMAERGTPEGGDLRKQWSECEDIVRYARPIIAPAYPLKKSVLEYFGYKYESAFAT